MGTTEYTCDDCGEEAPDGEGYIEDGHRVCGECEWQQFLTWCGYKNINPYADEDEPEWTAEDPFKRWVACGRP